MRSSLCSGRALGPDGGVMNGLLSEALYQQIQHHYEKKKTVLYVSSPNLSVELIGALIISTDI